MPHWPPTRSHKEHTCSSQSCLLWTRCFCSHQPGSQIPGSTVQLPQLFLAPDFGLLFFRLQPLTHFWLNLFLQCQLPPWSQVRTPLFSPAPGWPWSGMAPRRSKGKAVVLVSLPGSCPSALPCPSIPTPGLPWSCPWPLSPIWALIPRVSPSPEAALFWAQFLTSCFPFPVTPNPLSLLSYWNQSRRLAGFWGEWESRGEGSIASAEP
jgi:hypothetical protein